MAYTYEELLKMGAKPVENTSKGLSYEELLKMGAKPVEPTQQTQPIEQRPAEDKNFFVQFGKMIGDIGYQTYTTDVKQRSEALAKAGVPTPVIAGLNMPQEIIGQAAKQIPELGGQIAGSISKAIPRIVASTQEVLTGKPVDYGNLPIIGKVEGVSSLSGKRASELQKFSEEVLPKKIDPKLVGLTALGLTGLEYIADIQQTGDIAKKGLSYLAKNTTGKQNLKGMSKELSTAVMPGRMKAEQLNKWNRDVERSGQIINEQIKENQITNEGVKKISNFQDLYDSTMQAKSNIWKKVKSLVQSEGKTVAIDGDEIAKSLDEVITPEIKRENPQIIDRINQLKKAYKGSKIDVEEAENILESKNAALNSFYNNRGNAMARYKTDWELRADEIIARKLREGLNKSIDGFKDLKQDYGSLVNFSDKVSRRQGTLLGQVDKVNLIQQYSWVEGLGRAAKAVGNGDWLDAATELLRIPTANVVKYLNSSDFHASKAFQELDKTGTFDTIVRFLNKANVEGGDKATQWLKSITPTLKMRKGSFTPFADINPKQALSEVGGEGDLMSEARKYSTPEEFVKEYYTPSSYNITPGKTSLERLPETGQYHGAGVTNLKSIIDSGELKTSISKLDNAGENVVSLSGNRGTASSYGPVFELKEPVNVKEPPVGTVKGDYYKGFEYRASENIPLSNIKSVTLKLNKSEGLNTKIMWDYSGKNPEYISAKELGKIFSDKGIKVFFDDGSFGSKSQLTDIWNKANKLIKR